MIYFVSSNYNTLYIREWKENGNEVSIFIERTECKRQSRATLIMRNYEIEIKSLLGSKERADELKDMLRKVDSSTKLVSSNEQLNHYFMDGDFSKLCKATELLFSKDNASKLREIIDEGHDFSVRTREIDGKILLVIKASIDDTTSANGISRIEFEEEVKDKTLDELDKILLDSDFKYQAKWSREREEYICKGVCVSIDKNAGYGYLAEFEKIITDQNKSEETQKELRSFMKEVGALELAQDRLGRMFAYYNEHWPEYYGTDKIFNIE